MKKTIIAVLLACGCSTQPETFEQTNVTHTLSAAPIQGFQHQAAKSRFALGRMMSEESDVEKIRIVGEFGVFSTNRKTGFVAAVPNADSPAVSKGPYSASGEVHNERAKAYFVDAGLPADQIMNISANASMAGSLEEGKGPLEEKMQLARYDTVIRRSLDGVEVGDSFASVSFNSDGDVISEYVYWPKLDGAILSQIREMQTARESVERLIPAELSERQLVIHHNTATDSSPFEAVVTYDARLKGKMSLTRHFDAAGQEVRFAREISPPETPRPIRKQSTLP